MTSFQQTLGAEEGVAEELAETQRAISIAEFFEKNKHMLGFDSGARGLVTAVKEAVDNALDATEEAGILPDIYVEIEEVGDYYRLTVEDNGPGITKEQLPKIFGKLLYGSRFHVREQNRGQQGIGISAAVLYSQLTSGKPAEITSRPKGADRAQYFELIIDTDENEPEIRAEEETTWDRPHGTRIELEMEANMRARQQLHDYVLHTAVVNPHARIELREPGLDEPLKFERATDELPAETDEIRPHPHGVELGTLLKMLKATDSHSVSGFLQGEFTRVGKKTADGIIDSFRDEHFGRELSWSSPDSHEDADVRRAVQQAVSNKGKEATADFADRIANVLEERERMSYHELETIADNAADAVEEEHPKAFGSTVRENAVEAVWAQVTGDAAAGDDGEASMGDAEANLDAETRRRADVYALIDDATSDRKDDETLDGLARRIAEKLTAETGPRDRLTLDELEDYVARSADMTEKQGDGVSIGDTARENVIEALWEISRTVPDEPPKVRSLQDDRNSASSLLEGMRSVDVMAPPTSCLAPITDGLIEAGLKKEYDADFYAASTRDADVHGGDPFIVEAGIAYGGEIAEEGSVDVMRFANRVPLVYQRGACATTDVVKSIGWRNYNLEQPGGSGIPNGPAVIMVHVASTNVPFTSESKDAVANVPAMEDEIELAIREAARELKSFLKKRQSMQQRKHKQNKLGEILPEMARKVAEVTDQDEPVFDDALARIMNNVLIERSVEANGDATTVSVTVENNSDRSESPKLTEIVTAEPRDVSDGASVTEMDGEYFLTWEPSVGGGESATLAYEIDGDAEYDLQVDGVEDPKLTVSE
ncbi:DNA topoisomerase VI subunit B [Salinarchaeum laminariae]|uniref:DNA topoisomerase VI subunit B n=1 Tax=Salinarchaeum laminariae TaxID=869888 RepID=UPI0020C00C0E|nr:DNA topoisomerase VI subunit B [Salinarchaeum laminariae]